MWNPLGWSECNHHSEKTKSKKRTGLLILVLLFIIGVLGAVKIIPQYTGYRGFLRKVMSAYEKYDIDALVAMSSVYIITLMQKTQRKKALKIQLEIQWILLKPM